MSATERPGSSIDLGGECPVKPYVFSETRPAMGGFRMFDELLADCPALRSEEAQGYYVLSNADAIIDGLQHPELFSSTAPVPTDPDPFFKLIPMMVDPPEHRSWRRLLNPFFSATRVATLEPVVRRRCEDLVGRMLESGQTECDLVDDFAAKFPTSIFLDLLGLPQAHFEQFMAWENSVLRHTKDGDVDRGSQRKAMGEVRAYFQQLIGERRADPASEVADDLVSQIVRWTLDGEPIADDDLLSLCLLLFMAGLDTVTSQLSYAYLHLATHPLDQRRLREHPDAIPNAVEEFLRLHPIVQTARKVTRDVDFHGLRLETGEMVAFPLAASGRDPSLHERPAEFDLDRETSRQTSFGVGPHRCLGSHLARLELSMALEVWSQQVPEFRLVGVQDDLEEHAGGVFGLYSLPITWSAPNEG